MDGWQGEQVAGACYMRKERGNWICSALRGEGAGEIRLLVPGGRV